LNLVQCYALTNNKSILNRLFVLFEQSKAQALRDAVRQQQIFSALPEMVTNQLTGIRQELGAIRSDLLDIQLVGAKKDTTKLNLLLKREFELTTSYTDKLDSLQKQYPWLAQLLQTESTPNISNTLANLSDTTAILSWFDAGDHYLSIVVRRNGLSLVDLPVDSVFRRQLSDFIALLPDRERQESRPNEYFSAAYALYNKLWPEQILNGIRKVVIVPDGALCHLPFEALITAGWSGRFGEAPYLLNRYDVSYNWSAVWPVSTTPVGDRLLFAAPFEREGHDKLPALVKSGEEKPEGIVMHNLEGPEATAAAFLKEAPAYGVLHLATHAHADSTAAPGIEFFDKTLTIPEISGQRFNASLVSLSACETGAGRYAQGEGVLSLAYAFAYAGAQSLAASQWAVNELSTASLFTQFYKHLKNGVSKSAALRQSKLDYLHSSGLDTRKAPYFWAAFTLTGTDGAIVLKSDYSRWMWSSLVALMLVAGFGYGIRRRKNA
jgi:CHAT domain-containing protein